MNNTQIRNHFQRIVYKSKGVYQAQIALTNLCNAACVFCFRGNQDHTNEMSDEKLLELLYDLKKLNCTEIQLSGGEPTLRKNWREVIKLSRSLGISTILTTNGTVLTSDDIDFIHKSYLNKVLLSLHSLDDKTNKMIMNYNYDVNKLVDKILYMKEKGVNVVVSCVLNKFNIDSFSEFEAFFMNHDITVNAALSHATYDKDKNNHLEDFQPSDAQIENFYLSNPHRNFENKNTICAAGRDVAFIDCDGKVYPCSQTRIELGDIFKNSLKDIITNSPSKKVFEMVRYEQFVECNNCEVNSSCDNCIGINEAETKSIFKPAPSKCRFAKIRSKVKKIAQETNDVS